MVLGHGNLFSRKFVFIDRPVEHPNIKLSTTALTYFDPAQYLCEMQTGLIARSRAGTHDQIITAQIFNTHGTRQFCSRVSSGHSQPLQGAVTAQRIAFEPGSHRQPLRRQLSWPKQRSDRFVYSPTPSTTVFSPGSVHCWQ